MANIVSKSLKVVIVKKLKQRKNVTETFVKGTVLGLSRHDQLTIPLNKAPWPELSSR